jgi:hypothetical protein
MPLSRLSRKRVSESNGEIYDRYLRQRGNVLNTMAVSSQSSPALQTRRGMKLFPHPKAALVKHHR